MWKEKNCISSKTFLKLSFCFVVLREDKFPLLLFLIECCTTVINIFLRLPPLSMKDNRPEMQKHLREISLIHTQTHTQKHTSIHIHTHTHTNKQIIPQKQETASMSLLLVLLKND